MSLIEFALDHLLALDFASGNHCRRYCYFVALPPPNCPERHKWLFETVNHDDWTCYSAYSIERCRPMIIYGFVKLTDAVYFKLRWT